MARDYAKRPRKRSSGRKKDTPGWLWLLVGLAVGLFVAFLVYLNQHHAGTSTRVAQRTSRSAQERHAEGAKRPNEGAGTGGKSASRAKHDQKTDTASATSRTNGSPKPGAGTSTSSAAADGKDASRKPINYDFYKILPESEVEVPEGKAEKSKPVATPGKYILQVGSFRSLSEADSRKAELALLGIVANVQAVSNDGKLTWHRVRIGPYSDLAQLNKIRQTLRDNHIEFVTMKERS